MSLVGLGEFFRLRVCAFILRIRFMSFLGFVVLGGNFKFGCWFFEIFG